MCLLSFIRMKFKESSSKALEIHNRVDDIITQQEKFQAPCCQKNKLCILSSSIF
jgi:hypothetical protein